MIVSVSRKGPWLLIVGGEIQWSRRDGGQMEGRGGGGGVGGLVERGGWGKWW